MTTIFSRDVDCVHCGASNTVPGIISTNAFGSMDLSMRPPPTERNMLARQIHECSEGGYCTPQLDVPAVARGSLEAMSYQAILDDKACPWLARRYVAHAL